jgi:hypothetical protein
VTTAAHKSLSDVTCSPAPRNPCGTVDGVLGACRYTNTKGLKNKKTFFYFFKKNNCGTLDGALGACRYENEILYRSDMNSA